MSFQSSGGARITATRWVSSLLVLVGLVGLPGDSTAQTMPAGFSREVVFTGLDLPTAVDFSRDGRVFVAEKSGIVKVFDDLDDMSPVVFADLTTNVYNAYDRGLLSLRLHPEFPETPYVYVFYSYDAPIGGEAPFWGSEGELSDPCPDPPGSHSDGCVISGRLSRLTAKGNSFVDETVLINDWCQQFPSHSVGDLAFGSDGALYASGGEGASFRFADYGQEGTPPNPCGDPTGGTGSIPTLPGAEGGALRAQDLRTRADPTGLGGSVIRIDPLTGVAYQDNPLYDDPDPNAARIVAYGLRNPFRIALRPGTGEVYVTDNGWNTFDEIDLVSDGDDSTIENFGWPCYEGRNRQAAYESAGLDLCMGLYEHPDATTGALLLYKHGVAVAPDETCRQGGGSPSGIAFYEGGSYPEKYDGALFFADYTRGCMWSALADSSGRPDPNTVSEFAEVEGVVDLETGSGGDLFYVDITGSIGRIRYGESNQPPVAHASASPRFGSVPLAVEFNAEGSTDPDGGVVSYAWDLDADGLYDDAFGPSASRTYEEAATFLVGVKVFDDEGEWATDTVKVSPGNHPPSIVVASPPEDWRWRVGDLVTLAARASDPEDGDLPSTALSFTVRIRHCSGFDNCHLHPLQDFPATAEAQFFAPDHGYPASLRVTVEATDSSGLRSRERFRLRPRVTTLKLRSDPPGLLLTGGGETRRTPVDLLAIARSRVELSAPATQISGDLFFVFKEWSDGGERVHFVTARATPSTYRASYAAK